eukprot:gnl/TRDRNA2_/TRDRNA2_203312_c0_seq1.p2 gnl/TRDRNA2_/TRDRNA2_203312_c0~~gnl/TRDRNA2_/TRDRNA2_203312_c0_seq1.p2  ORF type:complete len:109 (-),score=8.50 gnl/TRDRNA2_/TRDRNA2_203312_c0_seq1:431-757(-)
MITIGWASNCSFNPSSVGAFSVSSSLLHCSNASCTSSCGKLLPRCHQLLQRSVNLQCCEKYLDGILQVSPSATCTAGIDHSASRAPRPPAAQIVFHLGSALEDQKPRL